jgi:hypothetical protein
MTVDENLFELARDQKVRFELLGGAVPVVIVDNVYARPNDIRGMALRLSYSTPPYPYPGKLAVPPTTPSLTHLTNWALSLVNEHYLPRIPPILGHGRKITAFQKLHTDFGIVDVHPADLSETQRIPHVDPVPVFGLVYLNEEERGGTLFFEEVAGSAPEDNGAGYMTRTNAQFRVRAHIESAFNRLAIYPGFVPHSGEISGDWIETEQRFESPRLTQRLVFFP